MRTKIGEIYLAVDSGKAGHLVIDVEKYKQCGDVVTQPFTPDGKYGLDLSEFIPKEIFYNEPNRIDNFKLSMVRYYQCDDNSLPEWIPSEILEMRDKLIGESE